jgi:hypothetical protein
VGHSSNAEECDREHNTIHTDVDERRILLAPEKRADTNSTAPPVVGNPSSGGLGIPDSFTAE